MKKLLLSVSICLAVLSAKAFEIFPSILNGTTNTVVVAGTNQMPSRVLAAVANYFVQPGVAANTNFLPAVTIGSGANFPFRNCALQATFAATASTTGNTEFYFSASVDNVNWQTNWLIWRVAAAGTATVSSITNVDLTGIPYLTLTAVNNTNATAIITNLVLTAAGKPGL